MKVKKVLLTAATAIALAAAMSVTSMAAATSLVISNCDSSSGWAAEYEVDTADKKEGSGALSISCANGLSFDRKMDPAIDLGVTEANGAVEMWIYVKDTALLTDAQVELGSAGKCDVDEYHWTPDQLKLQAGWNHVTLKFSEAGKDGNPNINAINHFRFYQLFAGENTIKIDDFKIINLDAKEEAAPAGTKADEGTATAAEETNTQENPKTGDVSAMMFALTGLASGAILLRRKIK